MFYSHRIPSTEHNYDIGNRELLVSKLALEEWRQWMEGAKIHFYYGWATKILSISALPSVRSLDKLPSHYSLTILISRCLTIQDRKTSKLIPCHANSVPL